jgi:hypothetical protein
MDESAPAPERKTPEDTTIAKVTPSPNFELESYISNYSGRCVPRGRYKIDGLLSRRQQQLLQECTRE